MADLWWGLDWLMIGRTGGDLCEVESGRGEGLRNSMECLLMVVEGDWVNSDAFGDFEIRCIRNAARLTLRIGVGSE